MRIVKLLCHFLQSTFTVCYVYLVNMDTYELPMTNDDVYRKHKVWKAELRGEATRSVAEPCTRIGSDRGDPRRTIMHCIQNIHTHSNVQKYKKVQSCRFSSLQNGTPVP